MLYQDDKTLKKSILLISNSKSNSKNKIIIKYSNEYFWECNFLVIKIHFLNNSFFSNSQNHKINI